VELSTLGVSAPECVLRSSCARVSALVMAVAGRLHSTLALAVCHGWHVAARDERVQVVAPDAYDAAADSAGRIISEAGTRATRVLRRLDAETDDARHPDEPALVPRASASTGDVWGRYVGRHM
jgi:hypothetical protein